MTFIFSVPRSLSPILLLIALSAISTLSVAADYVSHKKVNSSLVVKTTDGVTRLTAYGDDGLEVVYEPRGVEQLPSFMKAATAKKTKIQVKKRKDHLLISAGKLTARIIKSPFRIEYIRNNKMLLQEEAGLFNYSSLRGFRFKLAADEKLMGTGERVLGMDRRGHRLPLYNKAHYGYETESEQMYYSLPMVLSSNHYLLVFDNSAKGFVDLGKSESDVLQFEAVSGRTAYWVFAGDDHPDILKNYTAVSGRQPLPPRWALGSYASRFGYHSDAEVRDVVKRYRDLEMPIDALVLDLYWFGPDIKGHMGNLDWDNSAFPNPEKLIADLKQVGIHTVMITEPFVLSSSNKWQEAVDQKVLAKSLNGEVKRFDFYFGNTGLIDVFDNNANDWFWQAYQRLIDIGVDGLWGDLGEPEVHPADTLHYLSSTKQTVTADEIHNAYGHQWAAFVDRYHRRDYPDKRPMIMMRSGFAGSQRYGMIPWTGDVNRSWGGLQSQVELSLQMGVMGLGYIHSDIGGFAGGESFDKELYNRWLQFGAFQPVFRPHAQEHIPSEPVFHDPQTIAIAKKYLSLRYRLMPYLYTLAWENQQTGLPLARPVFYIDDDPRWIDNTQSYLWGEDFLVAPVVQSGVEQINVEVPEGVWFDYWTDERFDRRASNQAINVKAPLDTLPLLVRGGALIPMLPEAPTSLNEYSTESLQLHYYPDESVERSSAVVYDDDGLSPDAGEMGQHELLRFSANHQNSTFHLELARDQGAYANAPSQRQMELVVHHWQGEPKKIQLNGAVLSPEHYRFENGLLSIQWQWDHQPQTLIVQ